MSDRDGMKPRLLLVEDDPISCSFMVAALSALPVEVDAVDTMAAALALAVGHHLWLLDANLPDGSGSGLLGALRARHPGIPALAHTADDSPALHEALLAAGFEQVLVKPLAASQLQEAVARQLGLPARNPGRVAETGAASSALPLWDPGRALAALNGNHEHVDTLRALFLGELMRQHDQVVSALQAQELAGARQVLHQLKASSGFVGAMRLHAAVDALEKSPGDIRSLDRFSAAVRDTLC